MHAPPPRRAFVCLWLLSLAAIAPAAHAAPIRAAYFYSYMTPDHMDSLANAGFDRALVKAIGDSLTKREVTEFRWWFERGARHQVTIVPSWSLQSPARVRARPADRRYLWGTRFEPSVACPMDSAFWSSALEDRGMEILRAFPDLSRLHVDLEIYGGTRTHYDGGPCGCRFCMDEYAEYLARPRVGPPLERAQWQETRLSDVLTDVVARMALARPALELSFFDLDLDSFVHRAMVRALVRTRVATMNFTERTYSRGVVSVAPARQALHALGLDAPIVSGLYLRRFLPAELPSTIQSLFDQSDGCFIFTTYSLWQKPEKLTGTYVLAAPQAEYWPALRTAFARPDLDAVELAVTPSVVDEGGAVDARFVVRNAERFAAVSARWTVGSPDSVYDQGEITLAAGQVATLTSHLVLPAVPGNREIRLSLDPDRQIAETDETNNQITRIVVVRARPVSQVPPDAPAAPAPLPPFPATSVLDAFERSSGPLGPGWITSSPDLALASRRIRPMSAAHLVGLWSAAPFAPDQEAFVTFADVTTSSQRQGLLLGVQGTSIADGAVEVRYDGVLRRVFVATFDPATGWRDHGPGFAVRITDGGRLGARLTEVGVVEVYYNGISLGTQAVAGWPFVGKTGRIGVSVENGASSTRLDDFGGGPVLRMATNASNRAPVAQASATPVSGRAPLRVELSSAGSSDPDGDALAFAWTFADGGRVLEPLTVRTFAAGTHRVVLAVQDGQGGVALDTVVVTATAPPVFPGTPVLDDFNRSSGPPGRGFSHATGFVIKSKRLRPTSSGTLAAVWEEGAAFGSDQEAHVVFADLTSGSTRQGILLKVQGTIVESGAIEVRYDAKLKRVVVATYTPGAGWRDHGAFATKFSDDDQLGARARANGDVEVHRNGKLIGTQSVADWPFAASGGRIGVVLQNASSTRFDDFGGGTWSPPAALHEASPVLSEPERSSRPGTLELRGAVPNPFSHAMSMQFAMPAAGPVDVRVYDVTGRQVVTLASGTRAAGWHAVRWDGRDRSGATASPGVYFVRLHAADQVRVKRVVLSR